MSEHLTPQERVVSSTALALARLALRLADAGKRYADDAVTIDIAGPRQMPLLWEIEAGLGDLAEDVHDMRRALRRVRRGDSA